MQQDKELKYRTYLRERESKIKSKTKGDREKVQKLAQQRFVF